MKIKLESVKTNLFRGLWGIKLMNKLRERKDKTSLLLLPLVFLTTPLLLFRISRANGTGCDESCASLRRELKEIVDRNS